MQLLIAEKKPSCMIEGATKRIPDLFKILLYHCVEHFYETRDTIYGQTDGKG